MSRVKCLPTRRESASVKYDARGLQRVVVVRVSALSWTRYRSYKERQRVEVAPITLIIGRNGSGKSVISRLPVLLASGVSADATDPLDLSAGGITHAATYQDLAHSRSRLPFSLGAEVSDDKNCFEFETSLRYVTELRTLAVEGFWLSVRGHRIVEITLLDEAQLTSPTPHYKVSIGEPSGAPIEFVGLLPKEMGFGGETREIVSRSVV